MRELRWGRGAVSRLDFHEGGPGRRRRGYSAAGSCLEIGWCDTVSCPHQDRSSREQASPCPVQPLRCARSLSPSRVRSRREGPRTWLASRSPSSEGGRAPSLGFCLPVGRPPSLKCHLWLHLGGTRVWLLEELAPSRCGFVVHL